MAEVRRATAQELVRILREQPLELQAALGVSMAQLSIPTDGRGLRIRVSMPAGADVSIPETIQWRLGDELVEIALEAAGDYQDYELQ